MTLSEGQRSLGCNYGACSCRGTERVKNLRHLVRCFIALFIHGNSQTEVPRGIFKT